MGRARGDDRRRAGAWRRRGRRAVRQPAARRAGRRLRAGSPGSPGRCRGRSRSSPTPTDRPCAPSSPSGRRWSRSMPPKPAKPAAIAGHRRRLGGSRRGRPAGRGRRSVVVTLGARRRGRRRRHPLDAARPAGSPWARSRSAAATRSSAGLAVASDAASRWSMAARLGMAAAIANAQVPGAGVLDPKSVDRILERVVAVSL